ncbi:MAG: S8 family peptidase [Scytolyngbya sp. HA4215-MV1]|jgi:serine protease|nr:S8 family peptidase [Scytolyngbya sp. HA4215-MV1]
MKKLLIFALFLLGLGWAISNFSGLATRGTYDSIVLDFKESLGKAQIEQEIQAIARQYQVTPHLNSAFSGSDNVYLIKGNGVLLNTLRHSHLARATEFIEPAYIYSIPEIISATPEPGSQGLTAPASAESPAIRPQIGAPNDPDYHKQWNFRAINIEAAWSETHGQGITIAVIDTGISPVPDLQQTQFVKGYDFVNDREDATDDNGHGTHVAGTIAQSTNNHLGVTGIAYEAKLMPLKVLSAEGGGTTADIAEAIKFAADNGADVINMSLGGGGESQLIKEAIDHAHRKGIVLVAAAGNANQNSASYPARYPRVIGVSALDAMGNKAPYSSFGAGVDISAPGGSTADGNVAGGILQNTLDPQTGHSLFAAFQGTSMAAPHVAGVAALVKATGVSNPDEVAEVMKQAALKVKDDGLNHFGSGKLDAAAAVKLATQGKITFRDFFRWLRDNGYLNPRFWIDGGAVALLPKLAMVLGSYLLAFLLRNYLPFTAPLAWGLVTGSSGLFFLRCISLFDAPQWPLRLLGSSIPELGGAIQGSSVLNPIFASVLVPVGLLALFWGHPRAKWFAIGSTLGVAACLLISALVSPTLVWLGEGMVARLFLLVNALLCFGLARLAVSDERRTA